MILHVNEIKAALLAVTQDDPRFSMHGVQVWPDGRLVSTDGHRLICITPPKRNSDEYPTLKDGTHPVELTEPVVLDATALEGMSKQGLRSKTIPILDRTWSLSAVTDDATEWYCTDLETTRKVTVPKIEGTFPAWQKVMIPEAPVIGFQARYIADAARVALTIAGPGRRQVCMEYTPGKDSESQALWTYRDNGCTVKYVVMPMRMDTPAEDTSYTGVIEATPIAAVSA